MRSDDKLEREVAAICDLPREHLVARWEAAYGCPAPKGIKRGLLERAAAWHLQAKRLGGFSRSATQVIRDTTTANKRKVHQHSSGVAGRSDNPSKGERQVAKQAVSARPGTRLMREWNGRMHLVDVTDNGFVFDGKTYRSLSAIARRITGAHWSGPRFFGL
jgi:hypothetical protein